MSLLGTARRAGRPGRVGIGRRDVEPVYLVCERLQPLLEWLTEQAVAAPHGPGAAAAAL